MREIKFRAWDITNKIMLHELDDEQLNDQRSFGGRYLSVMSYGQFTINWVDKYQDWHDCIPLQFTGLLDKNGKEIYEGDILGYETLIVCGGETTPIRAKVYWDEKCVCFNAETQYRIEPLYYATGFPCEVIGNIYENPELLEQAPENIGG